MSTGKQPTVLSDHGTVYSRTTCTGQGDLGCFRINRNVRLIRERNRIRERVLEALENDNEAKAKQHAIRFRGHSLVARRFWSIRVGLI